MEAITWDVHTSSEELLVEICEKAEKENGHYYNYGRGYVWVKLSDDITVKYGYLVKEQEARTQEFAHKNTDPTIVHVPRVYRFFDRNEPGDRSKKGYLFMEYVSGPTLEEIDLDKRNDMIPRVAQIIAHLGQIQGGQVPGPIGGGFAQGYLYSDDGADVTFASISGFNAYLNRRLAVYQKSIDLSGCPLVLCHMDLAPRHFILQDDGTISLVNWNDAGLYPRVFEVRVLSYLQSPWYGTPEKPILVQEIVATLLGLTGEEERLMGLLEFVRTVNVRVELCDPFLLLRRHPVAKK